MYIIVIACDRNHRRRAPTHATSHCRRLESIPLASYVAHTVWSWSAHSGAHHRHFPKPLHQTVVPDTTFALAHFFHNSWATDIPGGH